MKKSRGGFLRVGNPLNRFKAVFAKKPSAAPAVPAAPVAPPSSTRRNNQSNTNMDKMNNLHTYVNQLMKLEKLIKDEMETIKEKEIKAVEKGYELDVKNREYNSLKKEEIEIKKKLKEIEGELKEVDKEYNDASDKVDGMIDAQKSYESQIKKVGEKLINLFEKLSKEQIETFLSDKPNTYKVLVKDILGDDLSKKPQSFSYPPKRWLSDPSKYYREPKSVDKDTYLRTCIQNSSKCREDIKEILKEKRRGTERKFESEKRERNIAAAATKKAANMKAAKLAKEREEYRAAQTLRELKEEQDRLEERLKETLKKLREEEARARLGNWFNRL